MTTATEDPPYTAKLQRRSWFTPATAKEFAARSVAARKAKRLATIAKAQGIEPQPTTSTEPETDRFHCRTLTRVRAQMSRLLSLAEKESDPAKLDRLAAAFAKHEEVERRLSDRSLPAVRRVQDTPKSKASRLFG